MSPVTAACPSCGAPVEFRFDDTFVRVCSHCNAVVARGDRGFDSLGRLGDLAASDSPLSLFAGGRHDGVGFQLVGRAQIQHPAGGGWEEWYARFDDGRWGWLSEAQGRFQLSFAVPDLVAVIPAIETLQPGAVIDHPAGRFTVDELGEASYRAAAGEMPYRLVPGERFRYADLSGAGGRSATIDYGPAGQGARPTLYLGRAVSLADLEIQAATTALPRPAERVKGRHVACPQCRGSLELRAPDLTQRVTCPYCGAVLDVDQGNLSFLRSLDPTQRFTPDIPLGSTVLFDEGELTVIGCILRNAIVEGMAYPFTEYLMYRPEIGYRWLVESAGHWTYAVPVPAGEVAADVPIRAEHGGQRYKHFQSCRAEVAAIYGELYWKAEVGDSVGMDDFTRPPELLSCERGQGELNWSRGRWIDRDDLIARIRPPAGQTVSLPPAVGVALHQPFRHRGILRITGILALLLLVAGTAMCARAPERKVDLRWEAPEAPSAEGGNQVAFTEPFELVGGENVRFAVRSNLDNSWLYLMVDLVNQQTGRVETFDLGVEYYSGHSGGESWDEGSRSGEVVLAPLPAGTYVMRVEQQHAPMHGPPGVAIDLSQGTFRFRYLLIAGGALLVIPLCVFIYWVWFEKKRWSESDHAGGDD